MKLLQLITLGVFSVLYSVTAMAYETAYESIAPEDGYTVEPDVSYDDSLTTPDEIIIEEETEEFTEESLEETTPPEENPEFE